MSNAQRAVSGASKRRGRVAVGGAALLAAFAGSAVCSAVAMAAPATTVDLSSYVRVGRFDLPEPTRTTAPAGNLLAQEASGVTYNPDTGTLFIVGDGGTSVTQVTKTGQLVDAMTLPAGSSSQGTEFYDTEGITYIGGGQFVMTEERDRQVVRFTYQGGTTLTRAQTKAVKLGTTVGNVGLEGLTDDPSTGDLIPVKETSPLGIFQTGVDFDAGTATNGSPTTVNSTNLFDPALAGVADFADVVALSNLSGLAGSAEGQNLVIISQESGKVVEVTRSGAVQSQLTIRPDLDTTISVADQTHEGVTMDDDGNLYVVSENGGGSINFPQLWVYAPATAPNAAPTAVALVNRVTSIVENTPTTNRTKVADVRVADDGLGTTQLGLTGADAASFEVDASGLYLKAGVTLDYETKTSYAVAVTADDASIGNGADATSDPLVLNVADITTEGPSDARLVVSEVASWGNNNATYAADWFELTNTGSTTADLSGFKFDDNSRSYALAVALSGVTTLAPGRSAVFIEGNESTVASFKSHWFGGNAPAGFQIGTYTGSGVGFGNGGDEVNVYDTTGTLLTGIAFGAGTTGRTFDNAAGLGGTALPLPIVSRLSVDGENGAFVATGETGSPGATTTPPALRVTEVSPWSSGNSAYGADWFEVTNTGTKAAALAGFKVDDSSNAFGSAIALTGVPTIGPGESVIFIEGNAATATAFADFWFNDELTDPQIGTYSGGGIGLSTGGDEVNLFDALGSRVTGIAFGSSTSGRTFDNAAGLGGTTPPVPVVSALSEVGFAGARTVGTEIGSPGTITPDTTDPTVTFGGTKATYKVDETVTNTCVAKDEPRGSGLASDTCPATSAPAASFGLGTHQLTATATDFAGNVGSGSVAFSVTVDRASLCTLAKRYVTTSAKYVGLRPVLQLAVRVGHLTPLCVVVVDSIRPGIPTARRTALINLFKAQTRRLQLDGFLTDGQRQQLVTFAEQLPA